MTQQNELRPDKLENILGQDNVVQRLQISISSALHRNSSLSHCLLEGQAGLGKTTLSCAIANELDSNLQILNGGNITSIKSIAPSLMKVQERDVVFIDEIHRIPIKVAEFLYPVLEDFRMDAGSDSEQISIDLPKFTVVGATTEAGSLAKPFRDRFTLQYGLKPYSVNDLSKIVIKSAEKLDLICDEKSAVAIASRSRGTPRIANNIILWCRDFILNKGSNVLSQGDVAEACTLTGIDENGVTEQDRTYLEALKKCGKPMGLRTIVDTTNIDKDTIQNIIEPFLLRQNLIQRTSKGRILV